MKLPDIQYRRVATPNTLSPNAAVADYQSKQGVVQAIGKLSETVAKGKIEYDTNKANAQYADSISAFKREMATKVSFTGDEVEAMGLGDRVETQDAEGNMLSSIPKYKVYAIALEQQMQDSKEAYGQSISSDQWRQSWGNAVDSTNRDELDRAVAESAKMASDYEIGEMVVDIDTAINSGQYQTARDLLHKNERLKSMLTPAKRNELNAAITTAEVEQGFRNDMDVFTSSGNSNAARAEATRLRADETNAAYSTLSDKELNQWADQFDRLAKGIDDGKKIDTTKADKKARAVLLADLTMKSNDPDYPLSIADINKVMTANVADTSLIKSANSIWQNYKDSDGESSYPKQRDVPAYNKIRDAILDPRNSTADVMAMYVAEAGNLTKADSDSFFDQIQGRDDPVKVDGILAPQTELNRVMGVYGVTPKDNPRLAAIMASELNRQLVAADPPMTPAQRTEAIDNIVTDLAVPRAYEIDRPGSPWDAEGNNIFEAISDNDEEMIPEILQILRLSGTPITSKTVEQEYKLMLEQ